jgi:hypothetical protein
LAAIRQNDFHDHADRGGLAGTVGAKKTVHRPGRHGQAEILHRLQLAKGFADVFKQ